MHKLVNPLTCLLAGLKPVGQHGQYPQSRLTHRDITYHLSPPRGPVLSPWN